MPKMWVEVCLISARGMRRASSLLKPQWYAVGWIHPDNKYCTTIHASGTANPLWRTKFATLVEPNGRDLALHVEVYSRDPIFLRERLQGTATVVLREFLARHANKSAGDEDVGSYQLRKRNSDKVRGFVDVSIRVSEEREEASSSYGGNEGEIELMEQSNIITLPTNPPFSQPQRPQNQVNTNNSYNLPKPMQFPTNYNPQNQLNTNYAYNNPIPMPFPPNYSNPPSYRPAQPPPPPSNVGYIPTFLPQTYVNIPNSGPGGGRGGGGGFGAGLGVGALAAGAVIFGDDFMSGFSVPAGLQDASLTISTHPPF